MKEQKEEGGAKISLHWSGDLTVRRVAALKDELQKALAGASHLSIAIGADSECDITLLQLLCAVHRTVNRQGKSVALSGEFPPQFQMVLKLAGFSRHIGCALDVCGSCLWQQIYEGSGGGATASSHHAA